ncbi:ABC transporter permease subunit [Streptomyces sp. NPDC054863]
MTTPSTPYQQHQQHTSGYVSPVPLRRATLADALASEWTKIRSVRSTIWTLGVMVVLILGVGALITFLMAAALDEGVPAGQSPLSLGFIGVLLGVMPVITLGVMTIASEYGTGMIRSTLTACPSRGRVLAAKSVVFFLLTFTLTLVATALIAVLMAGVLGGVTSGDEWLRATVGVSLYVALLGLFSLAIGSLVRHSAGAITVMIGIVLLPLVLALFLMASSLQDVQQFLLEYSIPSQLAVFYGTAMGEGGPTGWYPLLIMAALTAAFLGLAFAVQNKRDV